MCQRLRVYRLQYLRTPDRLTWPGSSVPMTLLNIMLVYSTVCCDMLVHYTIDRGLLSVSEGMVHAAPHAYHGIIPTLSDASEAHLSKLQAQLAWQLGLLVHKLSASVRLLMHVDEVSRSWPR